MQNQSIFFQIFFLFFLLDGQLGTGDMFGRDVPTILMESGDIKSIHCGLNFSAILKGFFTKIFFYFLFFTHFFFFL